MKILKKIKIKFKSEIRRRFFQLSLVTLFFINLLQTFYLFYMYCFQVLKATLDL